VKRAALTPELVREFKRHRAAWAFHEAQAPSYRRRVAHWVTSAKKPETRAKRLARLIAYCEAGKRA
jgi:uncharacterized protein YdeI (YjbR/CyaY-like superfamily)